MRSSINRSRPARGVTQHQHGFVAQPRQQTKKVSPNPLQGAMQHDKMDHGKAPVGTTTPLSNAGLAQSPQFKNAYRKAGAADRKLLDDIKSTPNASNAFRTFQALRSGVQNPGRLNNDMIRDLTMGVATQRGGAHNSTEGLLSQSHVLNAKTALCNMSQKEYRAFKSTYQQAGTGEVQAGADPQVEKQLLMKALGARAGAFNGKDSPAAKTAMQELQQFGKDIRGSNAEALKINTTTLETQYSNGNQQSIDGTCAVAALMTMKAENDPITAMSLRSMSPADKAKAEARMMNRFGRKAGAGLADETITEMHNKNGVDTKLNYTLINIGRGDLAKYTNQIATAVANGHDVPIGVAFNNGKGHALHISAVRGEPGNRQFLIHDTGANGQSHYVPEKDLIDGSFGEKQFGYKAAFSGGFVDSVHFPTMKKQIDPLNLGVVNQQQVDQGLANAAMQKNGQYLAAANQAKPSQQESFTTVTNEDLDDGIPIEDDFGI